MILFNIIVILFLVIYCESYAQHSLFHRTFRRLPMPMQQAMKIKQRLQQKIDQYRIRTTQTVCYDIVGCFDLPHKNSPLQRVPEDPKGLSTKFFLFRRNINFSQPETLYYDDNGASLSKSKFNNSEPLKLVIHGYMSKWNEKGAFIITDSYLKIMDSNVILMDWTQAARGPHYPAAAANTELVGRQLGILLLRMIENGLDPKKIHIIGFSLGAHVAGSAAELIKLNGHLLGRITGLDPAGPLYRNSYLKEKNKKLDREDAEFVDVVHSDSSPFATDGFGLWEPVGHVDFYPNGGQDQPGCSDIRGSILVSHFEPLTEEVTCSHIRAWRMFQETVVNKAKNKTNTCEFIAFNCAGGLPAFEKGHCFPKLDDPNNRLSLDVKYRTDIGVMGEDARGQGVMYFSTDSSKPFCGTQLQASVQISQKTNPTRGVLQLHLEYNNHTLDFQIKCEVLDFIMTGMIMNGLAVAKHNTLTPEVKVITAKLSYLDLEYNSEDADNNKNSTTNPALFIDKIGVRDMYGNIWQYCGKDTMLKDKTGNHFDVITIKMTRSRC